MNRRALVFAAVLYTALPAHSDDLSDFLDAAGEPPKRLRPAPEGFSASFLGATAKDTILGKAVEITIAARNSSQRGADMINARVIISDTLGNRLTRFNWQDSKGIAAGEKIKMTILLSAMENTDAMLLATIKPKLVRVSFEVYKIAWEDGEVAGFINCDSCSF